MRVFLFLLIFQLISFAVNAATVNTLNDRITSVDDLIVGSKTYNVTFDERSDADWIADLDFMSLSDASDAANALLGAINNANLRLVVAPNGNPDNDFIIPYAEDPTLMGSLIGVHLRSSTGTTWTLFNTSFNRRIRADFSEVLAPVPLPGAAILMGSTLLGFLGFRRFAGKV